MFSHLRTWITNNWLLKMFSLLLAFLLWVTIASDISSEITRTVDLEFQSPPPGMEITNKSTTTVEVTLRGASSLLNEMSDADIRAVISLAGQSPGDITAEPDIRTPFGVDVHSYNPLSVQLKLEETVRRTLPIHPNVEGAPAEGYLLLAATVDPPTLDVVGPDSSITPLEFIGTSAVRIDDRDSTHREFVTLNILDPQIRLLSPGLRPEVIVRILEEQIEETYRVSFDPSMRESAWRVDTESIEAAISGPRSLMAELDPESLFFTFDPAELEPQSGLAPIRIVGIDPQLFVEMVPNTVRVTSRPN